MNTPLDRVTEAIRDSGRGYTISLIRLIDDVCTYRLRWWGDALEFSSHAEASDFIRHEQCRAQARAAIEALLPASEEMVSAGWEAGLRPRDVFDAMIRAALAE